MVYGKIIPALRALKNPAKAASLARFFKCGRGEYGEGDRFWGIMVPEQRKIVRKYWATADFPDVAKLIDSQVHEQRLVGLLLLVEKFIHADEKKQKAIYQFYLQNTRRVNNWDLVDLTAPKIVGGYLLNKDRQVLYQLAQSENLWEKRIAIVATFGFIKNQQYRDTLAIAKILLQDKHGLIHKAVGWALREVGKKNLAAEEAFLDKYCQVMPRTMLRYAIEKFPEPRRRAYLGKKQPEKSQRAI